MGETLPRREVGAGDGCGLTGRGAWEVGDGADTWAQAVSGERKREGVAATVASLPGWAGPGRKREEGEGREASGSAGEMVQPAKNEEGRGMEKNFLFFFQIKFTNSFPTDF